MGADGEPEKLLEKFDLIPVTSEFSFPFTIDIRTLEFP
jgi:hypothetical protein